MNSITFAVLKTTCADAASHCRAASSVALSFKRLALSHELGQCAQDIETAFSKVAQEHERDLEREREQSSIRMPCADA